MSVELDALTQAAVKLAVSERAELAYTLIKSLDADSETDDAFEVERAWQLEIQRRIGEIDRGEVKLIPGDEVIAEVRRQLG